MGIKTIDRWLLGRLVFASVVAVIAFSWPVILISLSRQLPNEVIFTYLAWPALASIAPMILYHTMPLVVPVAIVWCYADFSNDGTLSTLHMMGLSNYSVRVPALVVAIAATVFGYTMSCWVAPRAAGNLQDVMTSLREDANPSLLKTGQFNVIDGGRQVIFFSRKSGDTVTNVFIQNDPDTPQERIYRAKQAVFFHDGNAQRDGIVLLDGTLQRFNDGDMTKLMVTEFDRLSLPMSAFAYGRSTHSYRLVEELGPVAFLQGRVDAFKNPVEGRNWSREALKRFGIPALALVHTLLGLALLSIWSTMTARQSIPFVQICAILAFMHLTSIVLAEQTSVDLFWAAIFAAAVVGELMVAIALMAVGSRRSASSASVPKAFNALDMGAVGDALWVGSDRRIPDTVAAASRVA